MCLIFPAAPVVEPTELLIRKGSNASLTCNTTNGVPDISIHWEKLNGRENVPNCNMNSTSGDGELEQYQLVGNGSIFEFAPVVFGDEGCYRCVALGVASDPITVTGRQHAYSTTPNLIHLPYYITSLSVSKE